VTDREKARHLASRQQSAEKILVEATQYKVCDQCRSILYRQATHCTVCGAYRFDESPDRVRATAREMGGNPFPVTSGTVPRI
jgi:hypothetical protein